MSATATTINALTKTAAPASALSWLPAELKLEVFVQCQDLETILNLRLVSRDFAGIYENSSHVIVKRIMERLAGSKDILKTTAMAVEAARVNPLDRGAVASFLHRFHAQNEVPRSFFNARNLASLGAMVTAASYLVSIKTDGYLQSYSGPARYTLAQSHEMMRSLLRMETARRLFHDRLEDGEFLFVAPFADLEEEYWRSSTCKLNDLSTTVEILKMSFRQALRNTTRCPQDQWCICLQEPFETDTTVRVAFSQSAGLLSLCRWATCNHACWETPFNPYDYTRHNNDSHFEFVNYNNYYYGAEDEPKSICDIAMSIKKE